MALITKTDVKTFLQLTLTDKDTLIDYIVLKAIAIIETYINRILDEATYEDIYNGNGTYELLLNNYPITSLLVLSDDIDKDNSKWDSIITLTEVLIHADMGMLEMYNSRFIKGHKNIYVKYKAGYTASTMPEDLKIIAIELCAKKYYDIDQKRFGVISKNLMNENIQFSYMDISKENRKILDRYKRFAAKEGVPVSGYSAA